jgi:hypothetical protein
MKGVPVFTGKMTLDPKTHNVADHRRDAWTPAPGSSIRKAAGS